MNKLFLMTGALLAFHFAFAISGEELAKRQARSVHLQYSPVAPNAVSAEVTATVTETQTNSYFCILGWDCGYSGIQDLGARGRVFIFSVWDPVDPRDGKARPDDVKEELRAKVLYARKDVDVARFGGEGTGARTLTRLDWKVGEPVSVRIDAAADGTNRTAYTCYVRKGRQKKWEKIAAVSTLLHEGRGRGLNGVHSFVEDFWRNYHSAKLSRRAEFSNISTRGVHASRALKATSAVFTADNTPSAAIDAGRVPVDAESSPRQKGPVFFLQTGGATTNAHAKLWDRIK